MPYEGLLREALQHGIHIYEKQMPSGIKGLYSNNVICINSNLATNIAKACTVAEELGHHHTSSGNILDQTDIRNRKQERTARAWAYEKLVLHTSIVQAHRLAIRNRHELADYLNVTEDFLDEAIEYYIEKYGQIVNVGVYHVCFEPLGVLEMFEF